MSQRQRFRKAMLSPSAFAKVKSPKANINLTYKPVNQQRKDGETNHKHRKSSLGNFPNEVMNFNVNLNFNVSMVGDLKQNVNLNTNINLNANHKEDQITYENYKDVTAVGQSLCVQGIKKDKVPSFLAKSKVEKEVPTKNIFSMGKFIGPKDPFTESTQRIAESKADQFDRFPMIIVTKQTEMRKKLKTQNNVVCQSWVAPDLTVSDFTDSRPLSFFNDLSTQRKIQDSHSGNKIQNSHSNKKLFKKGLYNPTIVEKQWPSSMQQIGMMSYCNNKTINANKNYGENPIRLRDKNVQRSFRKVDIAETAKIQQEKTLKAHFRQQQLIKRQLKPQKQWKIDDFQLFDKIGKGAHGDVFMAMQKASGFVCVVKRLSKKRIKQQNIEHHVIRQIKIQSYLKHRHLTNIYGFFSDEDYIYIILQLMADGNISHFIKRKKKISESLAGHLIKQVIECLRYMHTENIIHRDLKPQNIFIHQDYIKVGDLGCAVECRNLRNTIVGCLAYVSPQQLQDTGYDQKIDIWSVGILTYELLIGRPPFQDDIVQIAKGKKDIKLSKLDFPKTDSQKQINQISDQAKDFIEQLLHEDPKDRIDMKNALRHPFLKKSEKNISLIFQEINLY